MLDVFFQFPSPASLLGGLLVLLLVYLISSSNLSSQGNGKEPPGPKPLPVLGNMLQLDLKSPQSSFLEVSQPLQFVLFASPAAFFFT